MVAFFVCPKKRSERSILATPSDHVVVILGDDQARWSQNLSFSTVFQFESSGEVLDLRFLRYDLGGTIEEKLFKF